MGQKRKQFTTKEKVAILRHHLLDGTPVSDVCDAYGIHPTMFYRWQKQLFENGEAAFMRKDNGPTRKYEDKIAALEGKLALKDEVISEIMEEHVALKKRLGAP